MSNAVAASPRAISWLQIPVQEMDRAQQFYREVLGISVIDSDQNGQRMGILTHGDNEFGCLMANSQWQPSKEGAVLFYNVDNRLSDALAKVEANGGQILEPMHDINPWGYCAIVQDSEGNRLGLHSQTNS